MFPADAAAAPRTPASTPRLGAGSDDAQRLDDAQQARTFHGWHPRQTVARARRARRSSAAPRPRVVAPRRRPRRAALARARARAPIAAAAPPARRARRGSRPSSRRTTRRARASALAAFVEAMPAEYVVERMHELEATRARARGHARALAGSIRQIDDGFRAREPAFWAKMRRTTDRAGGGTTARRRGSSPARRRCATRASAPRVGARRETMRLLADDFARSTPSSGSTACATRARSRTTAPPRASTCARTRRRRTRSRARAARASRRSPRASRARTTRAARGAALRARGREQRPLRAAHRARRRAEPRLARARQTALAEIAKRYEPEPRSPCSRARCSGRPRVTCTSARATTRTGSTTTRPNRSRASPACRRSSGRESARARGAGSPLVGGSAGIRRAAAPRARPRSPRPFHYPSMSISRAHRSTAPGPPPRKRIIARRCARPERGTHPDSTSGHRVCL